MKYKILTFEEIEELITDTAKIVESGGIIGLIGDLGVGKTTFTKKLCKYFGVVENVKSPTFTYIIEYNSGRIPIYHFDVYRIENSEEIYEIGFEDYISEENVLVIVEWADKIIAEMPEDTIYIEIQHNGENTRSISRYKLMNGKKQYF